MCGVGTENVNLSSIISAYTTTFSAIPQKAFIILYYTADFV